MLAGIRFVLLHGWSAILATASFPLLQTYTALPLWGIACMAAAMITLDTYSHVAPGLQEAAAARFDEAFSTKYNEPEKQMIENHY